MKNYEPMITITQYSMTMARGIVLQSIPFDSIEHALKLPNLCVRAESIAIKNNKTGTSSVYNSDFGNPHEQLEQELKELFPDEFNRA